MRLINYPRANDTCDVQINITTEPKCTSWQQPQRYFKCAKICVSSLVSSIPSISLSLVLSISIGAMTAVAVFKSGGALASDIDASSSSNQNVTQDNVLTLQAVIQHAQDNDEWLVKSDLLASQLRQLGEAANTLPDPTFSISVLNLPTDGFAFNQEPMTQFKVGASQMFSRGNSRALKEKRFQLAADEQPHLQENRRQQIALQATQLWLAAFEGSASYQLVEEAKPLFDKLGDIVSASYASSSGAANQQDIIRAELELIKLNDRLISLEAQSDVALSKLSQFLLAPNGYNQEINQGDLSAPSFFANALMAPLLPKVLPPLTEKQYLLQEHTEQLSPNEFHTLVGNHALILANEQRIHTSLTDIEIAEQAYKPQYGMNASYAFRDDNPGGQSRADFFSIGLTVSMPLFSSKRQDANVSSATLMTEAMRTEKLLIMRELMAGLRSALSAYEGASSRLAIYENRIIPQIKQQAEAALNAYTNDTGDFAEVVRAQIDELDAQLTMLNIRVNQRRALASIEYFYAPTISANSTGTINANIKAIGNNTHE